MSDFAPVLKLGATPELFATPYSPAQWQTMDHLGDAIDTQLQDLGVGLWMGGEPTFVSATDFQGWQWRTQALGDEKRRIAGELLRKLRARFAPEGSLLHDGVGKWYGGEPAPRWALGCFWRQDGLPLWRAERWLVGSALAQPLPGTLALARRFAQVLAQRLGVNPGCWIEAIAPEAVDEAVDEASGDSAEAGAIAGFILPILAIRPPDPAGADLDSAPDSTSDPIWASCTWVKVGQEQAGQEQPLRRLTLIPGQGVIGLRLPLDQLDQRAELLLEASLSLQAKPIRPGTFHAAAPNSIRVAMTLEPDPEGLRIFLPPLGTARTFVDFIAAIEAVAVELECPVVLEGYSPPRGDGLDGFQVTPDPGVIEVNIHPASSWRQLVEISDRLYDAARECGLGTERYDFDGLRRCTGGGAHLTLGGATWEQSPLLRRPDLLRSLLSYWINHPSLSYLFAGQFVGPTSQSPRVDEARHESLYELEIAFQSLPAFGEVPAWAVDRLLRNLLIDVTGNTHRSAFCIDKLYPLDNPPLQLGLLELRFFAMPPHPQMQLLEMLLVRALVAWFWQKPYQAPLKRWGTMLHDRFLLPYYIRQDLEDVLAELNGAGFGLEREWFEPFFEFRFPSYGELVVPLGGAGGESLEETADPSRPPMVLELRHAIEPWHVTGEEAVSGGTSRSVDSSMERLQIMLRGVAASEDGSRPSYLVLCNGRSLPLQPTTTPGEWVAGVRFRARELLTMLHPAIAAHAPLRFELVERRTGHSQGAVVYHVQRPSGEWYGALPDSPQEASDRRRERLEWVTPSPGVLTIEAGWQSEEYPMTLDLRR